jgi:beta-galactosidase
LYEVKKVYQRIHVTAVDAKAGRFRVQNEYDFSDLSFTKIRWELSADGKVIQQDTWPRISVAPGAEQNIRISFKKPNLQGGAECWLKMSFALVHDTSWARKEHVVAWDQFKIPFDAPDVEVVEVDAMPPLELKQTAGKIAVSGKSFEVTFGKNSGVLESFAFNGKRLIASPLVPNFWRVPIDNDNGNGMPRRLGAWRDAGPGRTVKTIKADQASISVGKNSTCKNVYTVYGNGEIVVDATVTPRGGNVPKLPRFGMQMAVPGRFDTLTWLGRGPHETYRDRKTGAAFGLYSGPVDENIHTYVRPQENGNKSDVRWMALTDRDGTGLIAVGMPTIDISAWPFTMADLENAEHIHELPRRETITVNLDYKQMGVGGDDSWGARTHPEYTLPARAYRYSFRLMPYAASLGDIGQLVRRRVEEAP